MWYADIKVDRSTVLGDFTCENAGMQVPSKSKDIARQLSVATVIIGSSHGTHSSRTDKPCCGHVMPTRVMPSFAEIR